jgi:hypothetical protein
VGFLLSVTSAIFFTGLRLWILNPDTFIGPIPDLLGIGCGNIVLYVEAYVVIAQDFPWLPEANM